MVAPCPPLWFLVVSDAAFSIPTSTLHPHPSPGEGSQAPWNLEGFSWLQKLGILGEVGCLKARLFSSMGKEEQLLLLTTVIDLLPGLQHLPGLIWISWWAAAIQPKWLALQSWWILEVQSPESFRGVSAKL